MAAVFEQLERGAAVLYGTCGGIWVMTMFAPPKKADMLLSRPTLAVMKRKHPRGFATLTWVLPEAGYRMDAETREAAADVTKEYDTVIKAQATLIEGGGFQGAAVRAIIAGIDAMSRSASTKKVFSELPPSVAWCIERTQASLMGAPIAEVTSAIAASRDALPRAS